MNPFAPATDMSGNALHDRERVSEFRHEFLACNHKLMYDNTARQWGWAHAIDTDADLERRPRIVGLSRTFGECGVGYRIACPHPAGARSVRRHRPVMALGV